MFVEELTKSVMESVGALHEAPLQLAIPATLHDSLMARLDRLGAAKAVAQLGATLGREFSYELLQAVSSVDNTALQQSLQQLVDAELLYQRGLSQQATYLFKHALIQDAAYQSLLKNTRQQYHRQIAQVLEEKFSETKETQPELLAHHYTETGLITHAIPYWQKAGQRAAERSAYVEAIGHLNKGLEVIKTSPVTPERVQQELTLQLALSNSLMATKGYAAPEVEKVYGRALELCRQMGEPPQLFPVLVGLWRFYLARAEHGKALELGKQCLSLAQKMNNSVRLLGSYQAIGISQFTRGELAQARAYLEQALALRDPQKRHFHASRSGQDPGVACLTYSAWALWALGYPAQALEKSSQALILARELAHPFSLAQALIATLRLHQHNREGPRAFEQAEVLLSLCTEHKFAFTLAWAIFIRGWAVAEQGKTEEGIAQMCQGLAAHRATGTEAVRPYYLACLAEMYDKMGRPEEGLAVLAEALTRVDETDEREYEAELYRIKGELTLQSQASLRQVKTGQDKSEDTGPRLLTPDPQSEAEACFLKAIDIARKQQAKSLELRAATSLARLWQQQGKRAEAHKLLSAVYNWFTEGFDTKDLQEAKTLLDELS